MNRYQNFSHVLRAIFWDDLILKFTSIALAVLMWFYIDGELMAQRTVELSVAPSDLGLPANFEMIAGQKLPTYAVTVRGKGQNLQFMNESNVRFRRKLLANGKVGTNEIVVEPADVDAEGFEVVDIQAKDGKTAVDIVEIGSVTKEVTAVLVGKPDPAFVVAAPFTDPPLIKIDGPRGEIGAFKDVWTAEIDISGRNSDLVGEFEIQPWREIEGRRIRFTPERKTVRVTVPIKPRQDTRIVTLPVRTYALPGTSMVIDPESVKVQVNGEQEFFRNKDWSSQIVLVAEWPAEWDRPKTPETVLGPLPVQLKVMGTGSSVQVTGTDGNALPAVNVRGAVAGALQPAPKPQPDAPLVP